MKLLRIRKSVAI